MTKGRTERIIASVIGAAFLCAGVWFIIESVLLNRQVQRESKAEPLNMQVDLSRNQTVESAFEQTCSDSHGENITLQVEPAFATADELRAALKGLTGKLTLLDTQGAVVLKDELAATSVGSSSTPDETMLTFFKPVKCGTYKFRLEVTHPAAGLGGRKQVLSARYMFFREDPLLVTIGGIIGGIGCLIGVVTFVLVYVDWREKKRKEVP